MKDINIVIDSQTHKVQFPDNFLGLNAENLQGNINFTFTNGFVNGIARLELSIDCESGFIPNLQNTGDSYTLPILSSLLTSDNIVMQLVIEQTDLITYKLTTDTSINNQKTYYTRSGVEGEYVYTIVENPQVADIGTYYEAQIPIFKTHIFNMTVGESINAVNTIPDDYPTWIDTLNSLVGQVNAKIIEMNQALAEVDNLDIMATKEGTTVTITITRKDGSQQVVTITDGKDGVGIVKIEKTGTNLLVDTYTIYYTDDSTSTFQVKNGRGIVSIDKTDTNILTDTYTITYNDNTTSTFYVVNGNGVESIVKTGTSGLIDTYRISYTNGEYYDYQVANGNGIDNIQKTDTTGLVDTYTITYTNGTTSTYIITNGNGISNIAKTSTVDNIDTYTIYYTNGTTSTFTVTNSTVTNQEFQELQRLVNYNALYANALIKMNNSGTDLTINDTANAPMPMKLGANMEQATTTGKNLLNVEQDLTFTRSKTVNVNIPAGTYQITNTSTVASDDANRVTLRFNNNNITVNISTNRTYQVNLSSDETIVYLFSHTDYPTSAEVSATIKDLMISVNGGDYEPYTGGIPAPNPEYPKDIHTISGDNEIKVHNENFFNKDTAIIGYRLDSYGEPYESISYVLSDFIKVLPLTDYTYSRYASGGGSAAVCYYDKNKNFISRTMWSSTSPTTRSISTPENCEFIRITDFTTLLNQMKVQLGTTSTPYTPHEEQTLPLNLPVENLLPTSINDWEQGTIGTNGANSASTIRIRTIDYYPIKNDNDYFVSVQNSNYCFLNIHLYDANKVFISAYNGVVDSSFNGSTSKKINIPSSIIPNVSYMRVTLRNSDNTSTITASEIETIKPQLEPGTKANSFTPYGTTPLEYCKIGDYEDEFVIPDKQLFDKDNANLLNAYFSDVATIASTSNVKTLYISCEADTIYTISKIASTRFRVITTSTQPQIGTTGTDYNVNDTGTKITLKTSFNAKYLCVFYYNGASDTLTEEQIRNSIMINEGSTALPYEPYNNGKWYLKKNVGKIVLDGINKIFDAIMTTNTSGINRFRIHDTGCINVTNTSAIVSIICDKLIATSADSTYLKNQGICYNTSNNRIITFINDISSYTLEQANIWLQTNNLKIYYILATPEYILLNDTLQSQLTEIYNWLVSYQEQTNISQVNNDLPFIINTITCYDLNKLLTRVEVLESEV